MHIRQLHTSTSLKQYCSSKSFHSTYHNLLAAVHTLLRIAINQLSTLTYRCAESHHLLESTLSSIEESAFSISGGRSVEEPPLNLVQGWLKFLNLFYHDCTTFYYAKIPDSTCSSALTTAPELEEVVLGAILVDARTCALVKTIFKDPSVFPNKVRTSNVAWF